VKFKSAPGAPLCVCLLLQYPLVAQKRHPAPSITDAQVPRTSCGPLLEAGYSQRHRRPARGRLQSATQEAGAWQAGAPGARPCQLCNMDLFKRKAKEASAMGDGHKRDQRTHATIGAMERGAVEAMVRRMLKRHKSDRRPSRYDVNREHDCNAHTGQ
jgi:hypothetical protein